MIINKIRKKLNLRKINVCRPQKFNIVKLKTYKWKNKQSIYIQKNKATYSSSYLSKEINNSGKKNQPTIQNSKEYKINNVRINKRKEYKHNNKTEVVKHNYYKHICKYFKQRIQSKRTKRKINNSHL